MILGGLLGWWYGRGLIWIFELLFLDLTKKAAELFSMSDMIKTLGSPFRQDVTKGHDGSIGSRMRALGDNLISRLIGLVVRTALLLFGLVAVLANLMLSVALIFGWLLLPLWWIILLVLGISGGYS